MIKNEPLILDWYISPLLVAMRIVHDGNAIYQRKRIFTEMQRSESREHSQHRVIATMREMLARVDIKLIRTAQIRIMYAGDFYYAEPYHKTTRFEQPTTVDLSIREQAMTAHIADISDRSIMSLYTHRRLTEFRIYDYTSKGFAYVAGNAVMEYTVHGFVGWVDGGFHSQIERVLFLSGCVNQLIQVSSFSAYVPAVIHRAVAASHRHGSVFIYDIGMHCINLTTLHQDLPDAAVRIPVGYADCTDKQSVQMIIEHTLSLCLSPSGMVEIVVVAPEEYMPVIRATMQQVLETVLYIHSGYRFGAAYYALQIDTDMSSIFQTCFPS